MDDEFEALSALGNLEILLIKGKPDLNKRYPEIEFVGHLFKGDYKAIVNCDLTRRVTSLLKHESERLTSTKLTQILNDRFCDYLHYQMDINSKFEIFCIGISCLQLFVQENWTGPRSSDSKIKCLMPWILGQCCSDVTAFEIIRGCLSIDGEDISTSINYPELLLISNIIFKVTRANIVSSAWWLLRGLYIHQQILDEHAETLQNQLFELCMDLEKSPYIKRDKDLRVLLHLEVARIHLHYGRVNISESEIHNAVKLLNLEVNLKGAMGKRTRYQQRDLAQLTIEVNVDTRTCTLAKVDAPSFPKDVLLNDDVRLPKISFVDPINGDIPDLTPLEQAGLLASFVQKKKSQAKDRLQKEELMPYLTVLISQPRVWPICLSALLFRSRLESDHKRTIERSLLQMQELMELDSIKASVPVRLELFYCSYAPPRFVIASDCASVFVSLGSIQSALDIYLKLEMWDDVIACYNILKLRHKAAEVIRDQIAKKGESVKLLCFLGDATDDVSCYEKAWKISGCRSAQAQRHWGNYYFNRQKYKECIPHLKESVRINNIQLIIWFRLGYAALMEHMWEESAKAYRRFVDLEPESFEAWNNLAKAYIFLGDKKRAYQALHQAVKCNFDTWQVWDNLMAVSSDCGDFEGVITCYQRILDLKEKHVDRQILTVLIGVITEGVHDCYGRSAKMLIKKALELMGRITSKVMGDPSVWQLYARLTASLDEQNSITRTKTAQYLQKAHTAALQDSNWYKTFDSIKSVLELCSSLADAYAVCRKQCATIHEAVQLLCSVRMSLRSVVSKIRQEHTDIRTGDFREEIQQDVIKIQSKIEEINKEIQNLQSTTSS